MASAFVRSALTVSMGLGCAFACTTLALPCRAVLQAQGPVSGQLPAATVPFRPEPPVRSYVAIRRLDSNNERHGKEAWLVVRTDLREDGAFTWQVLEEGGSEFIRRRVLLEALEKEAEVNATGQTRRSGLTADNYTFSAPVLRAGVVRVGIEPRRRADMLVKGELLMSPEGELLRVEGDLVKRPSFWTKSVHLVRHYGRVDGTHVPVRIDMVAQVRLVGASRLSMTYRYLQINGRPVQDDGRQASLVTRAEGAVGGSTPR
jgi:hypothetical protein